MRIHIRGGVPAVVRTEDQAELVVDGDRGANAGVGERLTEEQQRTRDVRVARRGDDLGADQGQHLAALDRPIARGVLHERLGDVERTGRGRRARLVENATVFAGNDLGERAKAFFRLVGNGQGCLVDQERAVVAGELLQGGSRARRIVIHGIDISGHRKAGGGEYVRQAGSGGLRIRRSVGRMGQPSYG